MQSRNQPVSQKTKLTAPQSLEMKFKVIPAPVCLAKDVECFRITEYSGEEKVAINVSLNGVPGIVFQHHQGDSAIKNIITLSGNSFVGAVPTLFVYGQNTERSLMNLTPGSFAMTQVILKPHALKTLLGVNAAELTHKLVKLSEFSTGDLNSQLLEANTEQKRLALLTNFLLAQQKRVKTDEGLVKESLGFIQRNIHAINVRDLLEHLSISERQFERRFTQAVGISPQFYIRIKRFMEALRLMRTRKFERLTDVAHALNYYDQSHFIRDVKEFSGISPRDISQKVADFHDQGGSFQIKA